MNLFKGIQSKELSKDAFANTLAVYEGQRSMLVRNREHISPEMYASRLRDLDMSVKIAKLFVDNFKKIAQGKTKGDY